MSGLRTIVDDIGTFSPESTNEYSPTADQANTTQSSSIFNNPSPASRVQQFNSRHITYSNSANGSSSSLNIMAGPSSSSNSNSNNTTNNGARLPASSNSDSEVTKEADNPSQATRIRERVITPRKLPSSAPRTQGKPSSYRGQDMMTLDEFLYKRGYLEGALSDVTIVAFGRHYRLHRLILDRSDFFSSCFGGDWKEANLSEFSIDPEQVDPNITQKSFDIALGRLYGHIDTSVEEDHALPLLAVASFLGMQDLTESCVGFLLKNLKTSNLSRVLKFVTNSYYGHQTERLYESAKSMLYRDGWEMDMTEWDGISGELAAEIIGFDGFYVPDEWMRYNFVKELIDWRLGHHHQSLVDGEKNASVRDSQSDVHDGLDDEEYDDETDIKPLRDLLERGIYYMHMSFEELQKIQDDTDLLGRPFVPPQVIREALWNQMTLRQRVLNAPLSSPELGLAEKYVHAPEVLQAQRMASARNTGGAPVPKTPQKPTTSSMMNDKLVSLGLTQRPRRYFIPTEDSTIVIGDHTALPDHNPHVQALQTMLAAQPRPPGQGQEYCVSAVSGNGAAHTYLSDYAFPAGALDPNSELRYSVFPPFRFAAEFRNVRQLKEKKRVYSKTVFYAGSHWNIYIQKVRSPKNVQLGVYLHRAKDRESALNIAATGWAHVPANGAGGESVLVGSVDVDGAGTPVATGTPTGTVRGGRPDVSSSSLDEITTTTINGGGQDTPARSATGSPSSSSSPQTLDYYVDSRPQVQTYFKIFSPSKKGRVTSIFSSAPDQFSHAQSWGWKSSSLILDDSLIAEGDKESKLRFVVVLGNV